MEFSFTIAVLLFVDISRSSAGPLQPESDFFSGSR